MVPIPLNHIFNWLITRYHLPLCLFHQFSGCTSFVEKFYAYCLIDHLLETFQMKQIRTALAVASLLKRTLVSEISF
jgi:hypothetical protein